MQGPLAIEAEGRVLVLTGAGVSAESGVPTFRGAGGLWNNHKFERLASPDGFRDDPALVWSFYAERRAHAESIMPNAGHLAIAALEARLGDRFLLATQNVDGLHHRAGSGRLIEMHGSLWKTRCSVCDRPPFDDHCAYAPGHVPLCDACEARGTRAFLRPHIVWFGESLDSNDLRRIDDFMNEDGPLIFVAAGTSGAVYPAASLVVAARRRGASSWLVNLEASDNASMFDHVILGKTGDLLPNLFGTKVR